MTALGTGRFCFKMGMLALVSSACCLLAAVPEARACTGFLTGQSDHRVMGKSYDWDMGYGLVVFNPSGLLKTALNLDLQEKPVKWASKYPSITFDQYGCEMPNGGMNSAGLAIELMILGQTQFPPPDDRPALNELQFIQYCLDSFASVEEMVQGVESIRIRKVHAPVHYLACDVSGDCAAFEWLEGELVMSTGDDMPAPTLANSTYAASSAYLAQFEGFGGDKAVPSGTGSLDRFVRASALAVSEADGPVPDAALSILKSIAQGSFSKWNIVYDLEKRTIYFRTLTSSAIKHVSLDDFEADCAYGRHVLDIDHPVAGHARDAFAEYTIEANKALIDKTLATIPDLPPLVVDLLAAYPDSLTCIPAEEPVDTAEERGGDWRETVDLVEAESQEDLRAVETIGEVDVPAVEADPGASPGAGSGGCAASPNVPGSPVETGLALLLMTLPALHGRRRSSDGSRS